MNTPTIKGAETRHTPGPWRAVLDEYGVNLWASDGEGECHIAALDVAAHGQFLPSEEMVANAARIVLAVNSHDSLVEALKAAHDCLGTGGCTERARVATRKQIRAALKDAAS